MYIPNVLMDMNIKVVSVDALSALSKGLCSFFFELLILQCSCDCCCDDLVYFVRNIGDLLCTTFRLRIL